MPICPRDSEREVERRCGHDGRCLIDSSVIERCVICGWCAEGNESIYIGNLKFHKICGNLVILWGIKKGITIIPEESFKVMIPEEEMHHD